jgi:hypothetical protein
MSKEKQWLEWLGQQRPAKIKGGQWLSRAMVGGGLLEV